MVEEISLEDKRRLKREYQAKWKREDRLRNPEEYRLYYENNRDKFREACRKHDATPERKTSKAKQYQQTKSRQPEYIMLKNAQARANHLGLEFSIMSEDIIIPPVCPLFLIPLYVKTGGNGPGPNSPTLDRIDNSKGYVKGNVSVISHKANTCKRDMNIEEVERLLKYMKGEL